LTGTVIPVVELLGGALVLVGFKTRPALLSLGGVLVIVTFGHLLKEPFYEFHTHVIPRLALLVVILLLPREDDVISVDGLMRSQSRSPSSLPRSVAQTREEWGGEPAWRDGYLSRGTPPLSSPCGT